MEGPSSTSRKRPFLDEDDDSNKNKQKRVRFPKGKKVKPGEQSVIETATANEEEEEKKVDVSDPRVAAKERARRRGQMTTQLFTEDGEVEVSQISSAEVHYQEDGTFVDDGIPIEPFNLSREREEGYFDEAGNFVEYVPEKEEKDAWLDSLEVDPKLAERVSTISNDDEEEQEMSSDDIGKIKRRIANALEPGETVLQALKRLKGSNDKKVKMSAEIKHIFDQLTEDAMRLMDNGDYNVYNEEREVFEREAEGYEALARARNNDVSGDGDDILDMFVDKADVVANSDQNNNASLPGAGTSSQLVQEINNDVSGDGDDALDMFADEDDVVANSDQNNASLSGAGTSSHLVSENGSQDSGSSWAGQSDYVYDEASGYYYSSSLGYYYSSSLGYYYDPSTGLFCSASSGQWYKYNEATGTYDEVQSGVEVPSDTAA